jgi:hypothetical protein
MEYVVAIILAIVLFPIYSVVFDHLVLTFFLILLYAPLTFMLGAQDFWPALILASLTVFASHSKLDDWALKRRVKRHYGYVPSEQIGSTFSASSADEGAFLASMIMSHDNSSSRSPLDITIPDAPVRSSESDDQDQLVGDAMYKRYYANQARNYNPNSYDAYRKENLARDAERKAGMR